MKRQAVRMMVIIVLASWFLAMLTSAQSRGNWERSSRNRKQSDSLRASSGITRLSIGRPSWFSSRNSGINRNIHPRTRLRSARLIEPDFTSLFIPEKPILIPSDPSKNSITNSNSKIDLTALDNKITRSLVKNDAPTQIKGETAQSGSQMPGTPEAQTTLDSIPQISTTENVLTQNVMESASNTQTPSIGSDSLQNDLTTNQNAAFTDIIQEHPQNATDKTESTSKMLLSDKQLTMINQTQSFTERLNPSVSQSTPLSEQHSTKNQSESKTENSNITPAVDQKLGLYPDQIVKESQTKSPTDQSSQLLLDQSHMSSNVSQFLVEQSTPLDFDANKLSTTTLPSDLLFSSKQNQSKTIESQQTQVTATQSGTGSSSHEISNKSLSTPMPFELTSSRLQNDSLQTDSKQPLETLIKGNSHLLTKKSEMGNAHLLKIEVQGPAGKLSNNVIQVQILNSKDTKNGFSLTQSQNITHHPVPSNLTLGKKQASMTDHETYVNQSDTMNNESTTRKTQNGEVPVPVLAKVGPSQPVLNQGNTYPAQRQIPINQTLTVQNQTLQPLNDQRPDGRNTDKTQSGNDQLFQNAVPANEQSNPIIGKTPLKQKINKLTQEAVFTFNTQPKEFLNQISQQAQSSVKLKLNQTTSFGNDLATNQILLANITKEKPQFTTRKNPDSSKHYAKNALRNKFYEELCQNRGHYVNGLKYVGLADKCDSYVRCLLFNEEVVDFKVLKCPYGYFWENSVAACKEAEKVSCPTNPCQNKEVHNYAEPGNCRAYWTCRRKKSSPKCCPDGMSFHPINGCQKNTNCTDACPQIVNRLASGKCSKLSDEHVNWLYLEYVSGKGYQCRSCPSGTQFNKDMCACTFRAFKKLMRTRIQAADQCRPEVYFNFNHGLKDVSGNNIVVGSQNIDIHNGHAGFNGKSKITIWRFNDAPIGQHFSIQMRFKPNPDAHKLNIKKEHLISNCGWRVTPSIDVFISPYESSIHFVVQTTHSKLILNGKYNASSWNDIELRYNGKQLQRTVNGIMSSQALSGKVISKPTSMMIGFCSSENGFHGWIDHVKIYLCNSGAVSTYKQDKSYRNNNRNHLLNNLLEPKAKNSKLVHRNIQNQSLNKL